jgi:hypothetical protein
MKKRLNTLNEEMDRIKSLFTEERMFGNLVEQEEEKKSKESRMGSEEVQKFIKEITNDKDYKLRILLVLDNDPESYWEYHNGDMVEILTILGEGKGIGEDDITFFSQNNGVSKKGFEIEAKLELEDGWDANKKLEELDKKYGLGNAIMEIESHSTPELQTKPLEKIPEKDIEKKLQKSDIKVPEGINLSAKQCVKFVKDTYKKVRKSGDVEEVKKNEQKIKALNWCVKNYNNRFEKEGIFKAGDEANKLFSLLGLEVPKGQSGTKVGEKYVIKNEKGRDRIFIKKIGDNKFRFRGVADVNLFDPKLSKKGLGKTKYFKKEFSDAIIKQLDLDPNTKITITKGLNTNKMDGGFFMVS